MPRSVVITGLGTVGGFGLGIDALWEGLLSGRSTLAPVTRFDASGFPTRLAAEVQSFAAKDHVPKYYRKAVKVMARDIELSVGAAKNAVLDAGLTTRATVAEKTGVAPEGPDIGLTYPPSRMGCQVGAGLIATETDEIAAALSTARNPDPAFARAGGFDARAWGTESGGKGGMNNLPPLWLLKYLPNMLACHVTILHGAEGPSNTITCAEASGLLSLGESVRVIERDAADLCFSGGVESRLTFLGFHRMIAMGRLAPTGDARDGASFVRPYDPDAPGQLLGEGGGILVVEEKAAAAKRGARVYAEVAGFGAAQAGWSSAHLGVRPDAHGADEGLKFAIERALEDAGVGPGEIDAVVPHGAGIASIDAGEADALRAALGPHLPSVPLVTLTPSIGDCMAGASALAAAVGAMCLHAQKLPARLHAGRCPDDLQAGAAPAREARLRHVLVCTSALGGQNAALVLRAAG